MNSVWLVWSRAADATALIEGGEHAEQLHLGHEVLGDSSTHTIYFSWIESDGTAVRAVSFFDGTTITIDDGG